ncbi:hypothetical protein SH580_20785 [Coraliomargarita algicola]|uniref:Aldose 1-epimerase n=1 Tax=Coraliomargarita algicola TaxID=3092156 RepID=A0ABZ0RL27_9BACT|nr:hypothetical protein [Coraliomargarita sp. J2-16]WPJ95856.1 hypothetical protein SH580_20785 [Coraliomargarita sp. J2-16]
MLKIDFRLIVVCLQVCLAIGALRAEEAYSRQQDGFEVLGARNEYWAIEVVPDLGGKVISLQDQVSRREWLWSRLEDRSLMKDLRFGFGNLMGADELLPNLKPETRQGHALPDHGEVWSSSVDWDADLLENSGTLKTYLDLKVLPIRYMREISLDGAMLRMRFIVENLSDKKIPFLWAWHPIITVEEGDTMYMDTVPPKFRVVGYPGLRQVSIGDVITWPGLEAGVDLSQLSFPEIPKAGIKVYSDSPSDGRILLSNTFTGSALTVEYDLGYLPYLAIWLSRGVWGNAHHLILEPTNRSSEYLSDDTEKLKSSGWLLPHERREWEIRLTNHSVRTSE